jgi:hypothetical protein
LTGYVLQRSGHLFGAFVLLLGVGVAGALAWTLLIGGIERVEWAGPALRVKSTAA